jgi:hypothetical protein
MLTSVLTPRNWFLTNLVFPKTQEIDITIAIVSIEAQQRINLNCSIQPQIQLKKGLLMLFPDKIINFIHLHSPDAGLADPVIHL